MSYLGSKAASGVYQAIIALMPPHDTYIELFAGSGAVLKRKPAAQLSIAVDKDHAALALIPPAMAEKVHDDALHFLDSLEFQMLGRTLIYADPPYVLSTRTSKHRYRHELTDADHLALLQRLLLVPCNVILSGYPNQLYDDMLCGWRTREFQAMTRGGVRTEKLWFNFQPTAVHYATFAGENFTDRQRIKRKAARWAEMFAALPAGERAAVLTAVLGVDPPQIPPTLHDRPKQLRFSPVSQPPASMCYAQPAVQSPVAGPCNTLQLTSNLRHGRFER